MSYYDYTSTAATTSNAYLIWTVISIVVAIMGGLAIYFGFLNKENGNKLKGFLKNLYDFLNFKFFTLESIAKILYLILAISVTLLSFNYIKSSVWEFFLILIGGNILLRIMFEVNLILYYIFKNTKEINDKIKK